MRPPSGAAATHRVALLPRYRQALTVQRSRIDSILACHGESTIHDLRVALRRTTSLAKLGRRIPKEGAGDALRKEARSLRRKLSLDRSREVSAARLEVLFSRDPARRRAALVAARQIAGNRGSSPLASAEFRRSMLRLRKRFDERDRELSRLMSPPSKPADGACGENLFRNHVAKRLRKLERGLTEAGEPTRESLHPMRIAAKELRYTLEFLEVSIPGSSPLLRELRRFQDLSGDAHDRIELVAAVRELATAGGPSSPLHTLLGPLESDARRAVRVSVAASADLLQRLRAAPLAFLP